MQGVNRELSEEQCEQYFQKIKELLKEYRNVTKYQVSNSAGIPMEAIRRLIREGRLEEKPDGSLGANEEEKNAAEKRKELIERLKIEIDASQAANKEPNQTDANASEKNKKDRFFTRDDK